MTFPRAIRQGYQRCLSFSGRAGRAEFWYFVLFFWLGQAVARRIDILVFGDFGPSTISALFFVLGGFPLFAAAWRRMHDTGRSGLFVLYPVIVMIGMTSFLGFLAGIGTVSPEASFAGLRAAMMSVGVVISILSVVVFLLSPILVVWWLTRPSQPRQNDWGWPAT